MTIKRIDAVKPGWRFRSAITGLFVTRLYALIHPDTTIRERRK